MKNFETLKEKMTNTMDEIAKNKMKEMVDDFYDSSKKTKTVGDEETSNENIETSE